MAALGSVDIEKPGFDVKSGHGRLSAAKLAGTEPVLERPWYVKYAPLLALAVVVTIAVAFLLRLR